MTRLAPILLLVAAWPAAARAQGDRSGAAHALFDEGKKLVEKGDFAAACPKFHASLALEDKLGTRLAYATCLEKAGRTASAWAEFRDAAAMADRAGRGEAARERFARAHAEALEGKLVRLVVSAPVGVTVTRDGEVLPAASFGLALPVDPGRHEIAASAAGYEPWRTQVSVGAQPLTTVTVPPLKKIEAAPAPPAPLPPAPEVTPPPVAPVAETTTPPLRYVGYGVGAAGVALVGVGLAFGASASSKWSDAKSMCSGTTTPLACPPDAVALHDDAVSAARIATIATIGGAVAIAGGVLMVVLAHPEPSAPAVSLGLSPGTAQIVVRGGF